MAISLDILAVAAHPDDVELGCSGSLLLAARKGQSVAIADLSIGEMSTRGTVASRQAEADTAAHILGLGERRNLGLPDSKIGENWNHSLDLLQKSRTVEFEVVKGSDQIETESKSGSTIAIAFTQDAKDLQLAKNMLDHDPLVS